MFAFAIVCILKSWSIPPASSNLAGKEVAGKQSPELLDDWAKAAQPTLEGSANRVPSIALVFSGRVVLWPRIALCR